MFTLLSLPLLFLVVAAKPVPYNTIMATTTAPHVIPSIPVQTTYTGTGPVPLYNQCGGTGYTGPTKCQDPYNCFVINYDTGYAECLNW